MKPPLSWKYPHNSPYAFSENRVIDGIELEGGEVLVNVTSDWYITRIEEQTALVEGASIEEKIKYESEATRLILRAMQDGKVETTMGSGDGLEHPESSLISSQFGIVVYLDGVDFTTQEGISKGIQKMEERMTMNRMGTFASEGSNQETDLVVNKPTDTGTLDFVSMANNLGVEPNVIEAIVSVESSGSGFYKDNTPKVRFEGHHFKKYLKQAGMDVVALQNKHPDLIYSYSKENTKTKPHGPDALKRASAICESCAQKATSYGAFQIMGFNYKAAGYSNVGDFVDAQNAYAGQVQAFVNFISSNPALLKAMKNIDFTGFASRYNGPSYSDNDYDGKMQRYYDNLQNNN